VVRLGDHLAGVHARRGADRPEHDARAELHALPHGVIAGQRGLLGEEELDALGGRDRRGRCGYHGGRDLGRRDRAGLEQRGGEVGASP
jgi:hypothetical protein